MAVKSYDKFIGIFTPDAGDNPKVRVTDRRSRFQGQTITVRFFDNPMIQAIMEGSYLEFMIDDENKAIHAKLNWREKFRRIPFDLTVLTQKIIILMAFIIMPIILLVNLFEKIGSHLPLIAIIPIFLFWAWGAYEKHLEPLLFGVWRWMHKSPSWPKFCLIGYAAITLVWVQIILLEVF